MRRLQDVPLAPDADGQPPWRGSAWAFVVRGRRERYMAFVAS
jgi:hypothetical protein